MRVQPRLSPTPTVLLAAALAIPLTACGGSDDEATGGEGGDSLTYWSMWQETEPQAQVLAEAIEQFEEDAGITVEVEWQGRENITKLVAAMQTGDVPDLVDQQYFTVKNAIATNDQFTDVSDVYDQEIPGEGTTVREVIPDKYDIFTTVEDGAHFLVPYEVIAYSIWFNAAALPDVAAQPPATWDDFSDVLADSAAAGKSPLALDGDIAGYAEYWTSTALVRALGPGGFKELAGDESGAGWQDPPVRDAIESVAALAAEEYFVPGYDSSKFPDIQSRWAQGEADFLFMGSWAPTETGPVAANGFEYRSFNFPTMGGDDALPASAIGFAIPGPAENADAAKEFITYFLHADRLAKIASDASNLTPRADIDVPEQLADVHELLNSKDIFPVTDGVLGDFSDYDKKVFQPLSAELMTGKITADEFLDQVATEQESYWKANG